MEPVKLIRLQRKAQQQYYKTAGTQNVNRPTQNEKTRECFLQKQLQETFPVFIFYLFYNYDRYLCQFYHITAHTVFPKTLKTTQTPAADHDRITFPVKLCF